MSGASRGDGGGYFTNDRAVKYGYGVPRLALVTLFAFEIVPRLFLAAERGGSATSAATSSASAADAAFEFFTSSPPADPRRWALTLAPYLASRRFIGHVYIGSIGAGVNVQVLGFFGNILMLLLAAFACVWDAKRDLSIVIYLMKTFAGDQLAGKLDTAEWKLVLFFTFGCMAPWVYFASGSMDAAASAFALYARILPILFLVQAVCEYGDAHYERFVFFRHRYGFEFFTLLALTSLPGGITPEELRVVQYDLVICLMYRVSNLIIIANKNGLCSGVLGCFTIAARKLCFAAFGVLRGQRLVNVTDPEVATAVMRASVVKGDALERHVATPAWRPLLSLESVDGELHSSMMRDFHDLARRLPSPGRLGEIATRRVTELIRAHELKARIAKAAKAKELGVDVDVAIDARAVARLSLTVFVEYVFGRRWEPAFEPLLDATWEWRKEIAVRGKADVKLKRIAVDVVVNDLLRKHPVLWHVHGEDWAKPRYYSLILQPYLVSPAINVGDIAVAMARHPNLSLENAMRRMHPFPIFERYVDRDVLIRGKVVVRAHTQVIMFTTDFASTRYRNAQWPVFGAGPRACAGTQLALGILAAIRNNMVGHELFEPTIGHRHSGRHNDGVTTPAEAFYSAATILPIVMGWRGDEFSDDAESLELAAAAALSGRVR